MDINDPEETWKDIRGLEGQYAVSDQGRVKSLSRVIVKSNGRRMTIKGRILKQIVIKLDYRAVALPGGRRGYVHRLVCEAFHGPAPEGRENALHNNGVPWDNRAVNLRWGNLSENNLDRGLHGTDPNLNKTHCPRNHPLTQPNLVNSILPYRECKACSRERASASKQGRAFDTCRANDRFDDVMAGRKKS